MVLQAHVLAAGDWGVLGGASEILGRRSGERHFLIGVNGSLCATTIK
jgi:hypothetical protein